MAEERRRRRRGHRRGRGGGHSGRPSAERPEEGQPQVEEESEAPGVLPSRLRFRFGRRRDREEERRKRRRDEREERPAAAAPADVSPLSFWRRGRTRTYRDEPAPSGPTLKRTLRRIRGMYFPPWVPVVFIIIVVFGILAALFFARGAAGAPRINDHWHATYQVFICGERQPNFPFWRAGVHTHADGVIHIHPFSPSEEGSGARLVKWFEYGGGKLTQTEMHMPGTPKDQVYKNGEKSKDGCEGVLQVFVNAVKLEDWGRYIPQDGDQVRIVFGPEESAPVKLDDRTIIDEAEATRTVELEVSGGEADAAFKPASIELRPGETVKLVVKNTGSISHSVRVAGADGKYGTSDDFVSEPEIIEPGEQGFLVVRFAAEGEFDFQDPTATRASGALVVTGAPVEETPTPQASGTAEAVDVSLDLAVNDSQFQPGRLEVEAGKRFRINLTNSGEFVHNLRIAGPDGTFETGDDLVLKPGPLSGGASGELVGRIDEPGEYPFRDDFHRTEITGVLGVK